METHRWQQVGLLFEKALEQPPGERAGFLAAYCPEPTLRAEVESLLEAEADAENYFAELADRAGIPNFAENVALDDALPSLDGQQIGPYRVVREIGRGGMGAVYLAERDDAQFKQKVALKLLKRGMDTDAILQRFLRERQILARLHHPNIARLYDGGVTDKGLPYFAMEYIEGMPIHAYCDAQRLTIDARLRLFQDVGQAVQYAHRNLIVHRDLKPSNILVTPEGTVKLLDFGIAKLLSDEEEEGLYFTQTGVRVMTPAYAAPEQFQGKPVTTAADVYALGLVLYELLTGHRPYAGVGNTPDAIVRAILEQDPERPSTAVRRVENIAHQDGTTQTITPQVVSQARATESGRLQRRLSGDLDTICLKALRPEPEQRYNSAAAFVEDVKRHLAGLPVEARTASAGYRLRKFIQRNGVWVGATGLVIVALAVGLAAALWQAQRARAETARAEDEAATAQQVVAYLVKVFGASDPWERPGETELTARELLAQGVEQVGTLESEPAVQAELRDALGNVHGSLGLFEEARSLLEQALATRRTLRGPEHEEVAESMISLAGLLFDMGSYEEAEQLYRDALAMRRRLLGTEHIDVAATLNDLAALLNSRDAYEEAEPLLRESLTIQRQHYSDTHPSLAVTLANLAGVLRDRVAYEEAEQLYREALAIQRRLHGTEHPNVATTLNSLALVLRDKGADEEAEPFLRESLAMRQRLFGEVHDRTAGARHQLGKLLLETGRADEAEPLYRQALHASAESNGVQHWKTAIAHVGLGRTLTMLGRYEEAETHLDKAHAIYQHDDTGGPPFGPPAALEARMELYKAWGKPEQAAAIQAAPES